MTLGRQRAFWMRLSEYISPALNSIYLTTCCLNAWGVVQSTFLEERWKRAVEHDIHQGPVGLVLVRFSGGEIVSLDSRPIGVNILVKLEMFVCEIVIHSWEPYRWNSLNNATYMVPIRMQYTPECGPAICLILEFPDRTRLIVGLEVPSVVGNNSTD